MPTRRQAGLLTLYSVGHFLVDLASAYLMFSLVITDGDTGTLCFLLYNFCAFALQMPLGLLADRLNRNAAVAIAGFGFTCLAFLLTPLPLLCAVVVGVGNCLFHIGGGVDVLHFSERRQWMLGVFVSPGAIGLFLGGYLARGGHIALPLCGGLLLILMGALACGFHGLSPLHRPSGNQPADIRPVGGIPWLAVVALTAVVILRSYVGLTMSFPWKTGVWSVLAVVGLALGKTLGGILADLFGAMRVSVVSLTLCGILFLFSSNAVCGILAILLFNMTMPLTLFAMARLLPGARGFAFGALTFALFLGYLPVQFSEASLLGGAGWWYAVCAAVSLVLMVTGLVACRPRGGMTDE